MEAAKHILYSKDGKSSVTVLDGEIISYSYDNHELMHQKGEPGWGNTEIEMFPVIGATKMNNYAVLTPKGVAKMDQHGILRTLAYTMVTVNKNRLVLTKKYTAGEQIINPKFPNRSAQEFLYWPYDFEFEKTIQLQDDAVVVSFQIKGEKAMPYMLGFHPAFKTYGDNQRFLAGGQEYSLEQVIEAGGPALPIYNCNEVILKNSAAVGVRVQTTGFRHMMLWTEVREMVCIEPITFYPLSVASDALHKGFDTIEQQNRFEVTISPVIDQ